MPAAACRRTRAALSPTPRWKAAVVALAAIAVTAPCASAAGPSVAAYRPAAGAANGWTSLTAAVPAFATPSAARGVNYGGTTGQLQPLVVVLDSTGKTVARIASEGAATCASGTTYLISGDLVASLPVAATGSFHGQRSAAEPLGGGLTGELDQSISAAVKGRTITGILRAHVDVVSDVDGTLQDTCDLTTRFSLVSAVRREFAGNTSQQAPAVVELTSDRRTVNHFHIGWDGPCMPRAEFQYGEFLRNFTITAGRFGDTWTQRYTEPSGASETQDFSVAGTIRGTTAKGTFSTTITQFDASGAEVGSCRSGPVSWRAASG